VVVKNVNVDIRTRPKNLANRETFQDHSRFLTRTQDRPYVWAVDNTWASVHTEVFTERAS
jgi:hypothetical protein